MILFSDNKGNIEGFKNVKKGEDTEGYKILKISISKIPNSYFRFNNLKAIHFYTYLIVAKSYFLTNCPVISYAATATEVATFMDKHIPKLEICTEKSTEFSNF
jgi:hypothetical protein